MASELTMPTMLLAPLAQAADAAPALLRDSTLATTVALCVVLLLRVPVRRWCGARVAYLLWLLVPAALLAQLLPAPVRTVSLALPAAADAGRAAVTLGAVHGDGQASSAALLLAAWLLGSVALVALAVWRQHVFLRRLGTLRPRADGLLQAGGGMTLPAVVGLRARVVLPEDFDQRFSATERALILEHERLHVRRGDVPVQAAMLAFRALYWFNPLAWIAADRLRRDQELAVDAGVIARHPTLRRAYGEAMVKITVGHTPAPLACPWSGLPSIKERLAMLKHNTPRTSVRILGICAVAALLVGVAGVAWALQTPTTVVNATPRSIAAQPVSGTPWDEGSAFSRHIALSYFKAPPALVARRVAALSGATVVNPDALGSRSVSLLFQNIPAGVVLSTLADEANLSPQFHNNTVRFVARTSPAEKKFTPAPPYPPEAAAAKIGGRVVLLIDVAADGRVSNVEVDPATPRSVFDSAALEAARKWTFKPAIENGKPVKGRVRVPVTFAPDA